MQWKNLKIENFYSSDHYFKMRFKKTTPLDDLKTGPFQMTTSSIHTAYDRN